MLSKGAVDVELVKGGSGIFEIQRDGRVVLSRAAIGRFPTDGEVEALVGP